MRIPVVALDASELAPLRVLGVAGIVVQGAQELAARLREGFDRYRERSSAIEAASALDDGNINSETVLVSGLARRSSARTASLEDEEQAVLLSRITATAVQIDDDAITARASDTLHNEWPKGVMEPRDDRGIGHLARCSSAKPEM